MEQAYIDLLQISHEYDVAVIRAQSRKHNLKNRIGNSAFKMTDREFLKRYGLSKDLVHSLVAELTPHIPLPLRSDGVDIETKVLVALSFYATGSYQTDVGNSRKHCLCQASVSRAVQQVTKALNMPCILKKYVAFPFQQCEREQVKRKFYRRFRIPGLLGCIDGTHVAIVCPKQNKERYLNRKGYHSLNVMIICDSNLNIMCVDSSNPGSTHDSEVWANHSLHEYLENLYNTKGEDIFLLGDSDYPLQPTMMVPFSDPPPESPEEHYQNLQSFARSTVERCIRVLKARFRCLLAKKRLHYSPEFAAEITNACCVLHNIACRAKTPYLPLTPQEAAHERRITEGAGGSMDTGHEAHALTKQLELGHACRRSLIMRLWENRAVK